ncbi:MAG: hypothetical protein IPM06_22585 [Rhizobiales bacterium]|nr:hypothetical protein [Hyphomicrobiales bacterium]
MGISTGCNSGDNDMKHERDYMDIRTYPQAPTDLDAVIDGTLAIINEKALLRRTIQSLESQKAELLAAIKQQDAEIQSLRSANERLSVRLQAHLRNVKLLEQAAQLGGKGDRFGSEAVLWDYAKAEMRDYRATLSGDIGSEQ